jgi:3-phosphoshikimate 1-carboxyvinyltransferase
MMGVVAGHGITATFDGDASLRKRPMRRVLDPLVRMGASITEEADGGRLPMKLSGTSDPIPVTYETPVASAQVMSAVLFAAQNSPGTTTVIEK